MAQQDSPSPVLKNIFIRDISYEAPWLPALLTLPLEGPTEQALSIGVGVNFNKDNGTAEVVLKGNLTVKHPQLDGPPMLVVEAELGGVFANVSADWTEWLETDGAARLYPHLQLLVSSLTHQSGMVPLVLMPIDFTEVRKLSREQAASAANATEGAGA